MGNLVHISGKEFGEKLLAGERDFKKIKLQKDYQLQVDQDLWKEVYFALSSDSYQARISNGKEVLGWIDPGKNPIDISGADLSGIDTFMYKDEGRIISAEYAYGLPFKHVQAPGTNFEGAKLSYSRFQKGNLQGANFTNSQLGHTDFNEADLSGANFTRARFSETLLNSTILCGVIGLESTVGASSSYWYKAKMTPKDKYALECAYTGKSKAPKKRVFQELVIVNR